MKDFNLFLKQCYHNAWIAEKNTESKNPDFAKTNQRKSMLLSKNAFCNSKESRFTKDQEVIWLLNYLRLKAPFSKIPLWGDFFFQA